MHIHGQRLIMWNIMQPLKIEHYRSIHSNPERTLKHIKWKKQVAEQYVDYDIIYTLKSLMYF